MPFWWKTEKNKINYQRSKTLLEQNQKNEREDLDNVHLNVLPAPIEPIRSFSLPSTTICMDKIKSSSSLAPPLVCNGSETLPRADSRLPDEEAVAADEILVKQLSIASRKSEINN